MDLALVDTTDLRFVPNGDVADGPTHGERLAFARRLVEHGRVRG